MQDLVISINISAVAVQPILCVFIDSICSVAGIRKEYATIIWNLLWAWPN